MNFVSLKQFKSILEMNNKLKIRICAVGPIRQDGLARGRKRPARGPAKLSTRAGHRGHAAWPVAARSVGLAQPWRLAETRWGVHGVLDAFPWLGQR
jgi:hypothetical protein